MQAIRNLSFTFMLITSTTIFAADKLTDNTLQLSSGEKSAPARITDMAWFAGRWLGSGFGGENEEVWMPPNGGVMLGMYRLVQNGKPTFFELLEIYEVDDTIALRLKHFHPDFKGWEDQNTSVAMPFVRKDAKRIYFEGMTFEPNGKDSVTIYLAISSKATGKVREETFTYQRSKL